MTFKFIKTVLTTCRYAMCISLGVLSVSGTASATLIESIAALEEGAMYRVLFVTSGLTTALSSDIVDYNTFVSTAADSGSVTGSLGLTWKALASTDDVNAQDNTGITYGDNSLITMFNTYGQIVVSTGSDLWNGLLVNPLSYDEDGLSAHGEVWTGTNRFGIKSYNQFLGQGNVRLGNTGWLDSRFIDWTRDDNFYEKRIYAASSVVVKTLTDVPEPGTVILLSLGLAGLSFARYRRQA
jgi:hypothetical protein